LVEVLKGAVSDAELAICLELNPNRPNTLRVSVALVAVQLYQVLPVVIYLSTHLERKIDDRKNSTPIYSIRTFLCLV
jgi:hypothetical protein